MTQGVVIKKGKKKGKTLTIMVGVHGNEVCGPKAFERIIKKIKIDAGTVYFIYGNLLAIKNNVRKIDINLNRAFRLESEMHDSEKNTYERKRALELMPYLKESDALLDVHSSSNPQSTPFIICEPKSFWIAEQLLFSIRSHGWDLIEPGGTDYFVNRNGGFGICIECGSHLDPEAPQRAEESIITFLTIMGAIKEKGFQKIKHQREIHAYTIHITKKNFIPFRDFADFEILKKGECLGYDGKELIILKERGNVIIFPHVCSGAGEEAFILGSECLTTCL